MLLQRSFEDLGTPLSEVTFCVLDLETTGGSPADSGITEVGALSVRGGEVLGTFQTLVDPGLPVPAFIRLLTGISDEMLAGAPSIAAVLPSLIEFLGSSVLVAHNARFDRAFLAAALEREGYPPLENRVVDTAALARKVLAGEVRNHKLGTLAAHLRCAHRPSHRALDDALATTDLLHHLIERASGFGVTTLEDLVQISAARLARSFAKIKMTDDLPRGPGIYRFLGAGGRTLYVGKAADIRSRVRSYFYSDTRRGIRGLLRETQSIEAESLPTTLEAEVLETRIIQSQQPPYNRVGKQHASWYVKVQPGKMMRMRPARVSTDPASFYFGPVGSARVAKELIHALQDAFPIHRCARPDRCTGCAFGEMGTCSASDVSQHRDSVHRAATCLVSGAGEVLATLLARMRKLAQTERFEEAAELRDRAARLGRAVSRIIAVESLRAAGEICLTIAGRSVLIRNGHLAECVQNDAWRHSVHTRRAEPGRVLTPEGYAEGRTILGWLERNAADVRIVSVEKPWAVPVGARPPDVLDRSGGR